MFKQINQLKSDLRSFLRFPEGFGLAFGKPHRLCCSLRSGRSVISISLTGIFPEPRQTQAHCRFTACESWLQRLMNGAAGGAGVYFMPDLWREYKWMEKKSIQYETPETALLCLFHIRFHIQALPSLFRFISRHLLILFFTLSPTTETLRVMWHHFYIYVCVPVVTSDPCYITHRHTISCTT